jgi:hypothetical protein
MNHVNAFARARVPQAGAADPNFAEFTFHDVG